MAQDFITVLLVDDHPLVRQGLRDVLGEESEIRVVGEADHGATAIELVNRLQPDVVVMDINMPEVNGLQACHEIKSNHKATAVILLTAYDDVEQVIHAFHAGASAYCLKEIELERLVDIVRLVSRGYFVADGEAMDAESLSVWLEDKKAVVGYSGVKQTRSPLSAREMEILQCISRGMSNKEVANELGISHQTVKNHMTAILNKLDVEDRTQAALYALRHGWVRLDETRRSA
ncbi:MAG TPA: response regulator transcription factor [Anaerolineales bacterium]|nr:response regulator transcription factor [Anaerolineales bacterium]